jgi:hypothetical protein
MAYAPFNIGFSQGRAIRLGSSRSLKVYRGVRELGSSDPVLIIHDAFGGSGSMDGRTPDTVNNGNTWFTPQSGVSYGVTGGYSYKTAYGSLPYEDNIVIDVGTSNYTIEMSGRCADQFLAGVGIWVDGTGGTGEGIYPRWRNTQQRFLITEIVGGTATAIADKTNLGILDDRVLIAEVSGTTLTASLYNSTKTALTWKHVVDLSSSSVTPTTYVSFQSAGNTVSAPPLAYDFKVYTPPVEATRKINWDTYEDGIWEVTGFAAATTTNATSQTQIKASSTFTMPSEGFYNTAVRSRYHSDSTNATAPPYVAIWDVSASAWYVQQYARSFGTTGAYIWQYGTTVYGGTFTPVDGQDYVFVYLTKDPGGIIGWSDYA